MSLHSLSRWCLAICTGLILAGCSPRPPKVYLRGTDMISWHDRNIPSPIPGITEARLWKLKTEDGSLVIVIWGDIEQWSKTNGGGSTQSQMETITGKDGRRIEWQCDVTPSNTVTVKINEHQFDPAHGTLFLVAGGKSGGVKQLQRDMRMDFSIEQFRQLARREKDIEQFFVQANQRRLEEKKESPERP